MKIPFYKPQVLTPEGRKQLRNDRLLLILSGILLGLSFPPIPFPITIFFGIVPLLIVLERREKLIEINRAMYITAFVFGVVSLYWVGAYTVLKDPFLMIGGGLMLFINPVFFLIPSTLYYLCRRYFNARLALTLLPFFWASYEFLYMEVDVNFPWLSLANALPKFIYFIQIADVIGALGLTITLVYINIFIYLYIKNRKIVPKLAIKYGITALVFFLIPLIYGIYKTGNYSEENFNTVKVSLIQPDLDPYDKWGGSSLQGITDLYFELSQKGVSEGAKVVIWPETALPVYLLSGSYNTILDSIRSFTSNNNVSILTGLPLLFFYGESDAPADAKYMPQSKVYYRSYNGIALFNPDSIAVQTYGKMKLVPFGESTPLIGQIPIIGDLLKWEVGLGSWNKGYDTTVLSAGKFITGDGGEKTKIAGIICFESVFPYLLPEFTKRGAEFFAVVTNDSWYGNTSGPYQHKEISVLRAVENRRSVVRAANGGISCLINPLGVTVAETKMYETTQLTVSVPLTDEKTFFVKYSMFLPVLSSAISLWILSLGLLNFIRKKIKYCENEKSN